MNLEKTEAKSIINCIIAGIKFFTTIHTLPRWANLPGSWANLARIYDILKLYKMFTFLRAAIHNLKQTGSVIESTPQLARKMTSVIDNISDVNIIELGAGTGSITRFILNKISVNSKVMSFELNNSLFGKLRQLEDSRLCKINDDVQFLKKYVPDVSVDYIISGLPLTNIKTAQKVLILNACLNALKPSGYYIQFQYSLNDMKLLRKKFPSVKVHFEPVNIPPAFIYYAQK